GIADGAARRDAALQVHAEADRYAVVSQPRRGRHRSDAKLECGALWLPNRRADKRARPLRPGGAAGDPSLGGWVSMQDIRRGPPPDNGLEALYSSASINDKMLGHGDPVRVREGQRVLFRLLNASPTENVTLALAGHRLTAIALDGNRVPSPQTLDTLFLAPAERADVIVEMNRPGVWILGGVKTPSLASLWTE